MEFQAPVHGKAAAHGKGVRVAPQGLAVSWGATAAVLSRSLQTRRHIVPAYSCLLVSEKCHQLRWTTREESGTNERFSRAMRTVSPAHPVFRPSACTPHTGSGSWQGRPASARAGAGGCGQAGRSSQEVLALWGTTGSLEFIWATLISLEKMGSQRREVTSPGTRE